MAEKLILPVPGHVHATYLVPTVLSDADARQRAQSALPTWVPDPVGTAARKMLEVGAVLVASLPSSSVPPLTAEFQEHLGVDRGFVQEVSAAKGFAAFSVAWPPGWPPVHEVAARACAAALAAELAVPVVDAFVPKVLAPGAAIAALPDAASNLNLSDWVLVLQSAGHNGLWMTTKGMGRFGLPELQVSNVPPQLGGPWARLLLGVCARLLDLWLDALRLRDGAAFAQVPSVFEVGEADVAGAYNTGPHGEGRMLVRLAFDPAPDDASDSFLSVQPPDGFHASAGEYLANACAEVFGDPVREVRYLPRTDAMNRAMLAAGTAFPGIRSRFINGDLPLGTRLLVKHALKTPDGMEYLWAYVNSWTDPGTVLGNSAADAVGAAQVRAGRPIVISADTIIDWAIWIDGQGIVEEGTTNAVALREGRTAAP